MPVTAVVPLTAALVVVALHAWVYSDAWVRAGRVLPVTFRTGTFAVETPAAWFVGCLVLWVVFLPLYLLARR